MTTPPSPSGAPPPPAARPASGSGSSAPPQAGSAAPPPVPDASAPQADKAAPPPVPDAPAPPPPAPSVPDAPAPQPPAASVPDAPAPPLPAPSLAALWWSFLQVGAFTFGGGYAMLPMLEREVVERHRWATREELLDYYAIGQSTPGVIAVNVATFVGARLRGFWGAIAATVGVNTVSFLVILGLASTLRRVSHHPVFQHAIAGVQIAVAALITGAVIRLWRRSVVGVRGYLLFGLGLALILGAQVSPAYVVLGAITAGVAYGFVRSLREAGR